MSASTADKITDVRNAARPNSARVTSSRSAGGVTLACDNLSGWPTASKVHFVTYKVDSNSALVAGTQLDCYGIVSGNNITSFAVVDGTDTGHAIGDYVEMLPTAAWGQDLADALITTHNRAGGLKTGITLTQPTIADYTNGTHTHGSTAQGGLLNGATAITDGTLTPNELVASSGSSWAWQTWSSPVASGLTAGNGTTNYALYQQTGKTVRCRMGFTFGNTSAITGALRLTLPVASVSSYVADVSPLNGSVIILDSGSARLNATLLWHNTTQAEIQAEEVDGVYGFFNTITNLIPMTWTTNDGFYVDFEYEAA
jgi:hypothetical protein